MVVTICRQILLTLLDFDLGEAKKTLRDNRCRSRISANSEYLVLGLDDHRNITLCGSVESKDLLRGQQFLSYENSLSLSYRTKRRKFRSPFSNFRGFKFKYEIISRAETIATVLHLRENTFGRITSINYPHKAPSNLNYTIYLRTKVGYKMELRASRSGSMVISSSVCSQSEQFRDYFMALRDNFGSTELNPPTPNTWFLCQLRDPSRKVWGSGSGLKNGLVQSRFHTLTITVTNTSPDDRETEAGHSFELIYKTETGRSIPSRPVDLVRSSPSRTDWIDIDRRFKIH